MLFIFYYNYILVIINNFSDKIFFNLGRLYLIYFLFKDDFNFIILKCGCGKYFFDLYLE